MKIQGEHYDIYAMQARKEIDFFCWHNTKVFVKGIFFI